MSITIFINYPLRQLDADIAPFYYGLYYGLGRVVWSIALCYIIFACTNGYGGPINAFLSHPMWQLFSKLSYSVYLVHFSVIMITMATLKAPPYFSEFNLVCKFFYFYCIFFYFTAQTKIETRKYFFYVFIHLQFIAFVGIYALTVFVSIIAHLTIEIPGLKIAELLFHDSTKMHSKDSKDSDVVKKVK